MKGKQLVPILNKMVCLSLLLTACKKSVNPAVNAQITYEVKITGASSWAANYLDAYQGVAYIENQTCTDWKITFCNRIPTGRFLQIQVMYITPIQEETPVSAITSIYLNGKIIETDTTCGYVGWFDLPAEAYNLQ